MAESTSVSSESEPLPDAAKVESSETLSVATKADSRVPEAIARETETPIEVVKVIYEEEVAALRADAKITQYVGVIAGRRVRMRLQTEHTSQGTSAQAPLDDRYCVQ